MTETASNHRPSIPGFEPRSPDFHRNPLPIYKAMRDSAPACWHPVENYWVLSRFDDVRKALFDWETFSNQGGLPICLVAMTGAKTGKRRTIPLMHVPLDERKILVGSQGGLDKNPAWVYSVRAKPDVEITAEGLRRNYRAREVDLEEKAELWPHLVAAYPPYDEYQARTDRNIPVFVCDPVDG